ncbi:MAG: hypothetical protein ACK2UB_05115, partial [Anaerolineales bacterium]
WDLAPSFEAASPHYQLAAVVTQFAEILRRSPWSSEGQLWMLDQKAYGLMESLAEDGDVRELAQLIGIAERLMG